MSKPPSELRVAIAGLGAIGARVAEALWAGSIPGLGLSAVSVRDVEKGRARLQALGIGGDEAPVPIVALDALPDHADIIVEALPAAAFRDVATPAIAQARILIVLSVGALLSAQDLIDRARETGAQIIAPSGAILGLDALRAAAEGEIERVTFKTRKPPKSLQGAPALDELGIDLDGITEPLRLFKGPVSEAVRLFPANVNVAAAVSLAGIGPDRTEIEVWADPNVQRNTHSVEVEASAARFSMTIEGVPSPDNPRSGLMTPQSVLATLRRLRATLVVGT
jgi:aspartate dehydrogenase